MLSFAEIVARLTGRSTEPPRPALPPPPTAADLLAAIDRVEEMVRDAQVPSPVESRVERVTRTVRIAVPRLDRFGTGSVDAYSVMATATDYLPEAVNGYLRLPRDWANSRPVDRGRTSLMVLIDQLDLLARTMDEVLDAVNRRDAAALVAHGRFLTEKFGPGASGGSLGLDARTDGTAAPGSATGSGSDSGPGSDAGPGRLTPPRGAR
jgi:hypothetical protein